MHRNLPAPRRRALLVGASGLLLFLAAFALFPGCSDTTVSPGGSPSTIEWRAENPSLFSYTLNAVWVASPSDVFAVDAVGEVLHFDGSVWDTMESGANRGLTDVFGTSAQSVFAAGDAGSVLMYNGTQWQSLGFDLGPAVDLRCVWATSEKDVFTIGYPRYGGDKIYHYDGTAWSETQSPVNSWFLDLWGASHDNVYAVGYNGAMIRYDGTAWTAVTLPANAAGADLRSIYGSSSDDIYAVGDRIILHSDGSNWHTEAIPDPPPGRPDDRSYTGVWTAGARDVYVVTRHGSVVHFDGSVWKWIRSLDSTCPQSWFNGIGGSGSDVYVVGESAGYVRSGSMLHFDGSTWESVTGPTLDLNAVWGASDRDVFAVGASGAVLHFDGARWTPMESGTCRGLRGVWGTSSHDVFAAGDGVVTHFDGTRWEPLYETTDGLRDVWGTSHNDVFCVGESGIHHFDGTSWNVSWTGIWLTSVWGFSSRDIYTAGGSRLLHFDGKNWIVCPGDPELSISGLDGTTGVGHALYGAGRRSLYEGIVARFDGTEWKTVYALSDGGAVFNSVWASWNGALAAVGGMPPMVSYFDGRSWETTNFELPSAGRRLALRDVWSADGRTFFAVGDGGLIVRGERQTIP